MPAVLTQSAIEFYPNWSTQISEGGFTSDDLIDAYLMGIQDHAKKAKRDIERKFEDNLKRAQDISAGFVESMIKDGFDIRYARLKFSSIESFKIILFVSKKLFLSDKILELYKNLSSLLRDTNSDSFYISFNVMPDDNKLNEKRILADGFIFTYGKQQ